MDFITVYNYKVFVFSEMLEPILTLYKNICIVIHSKDKKLRVLKIFLRIYQFDFYDIKFNTPEHDTFI